ncbi:MAG: hypothetical protein ABEJ91_00025 [Candidatus Nanohaloarchaea archaeon]
MAAGSSIIDAFYTATPFWSDDWEAAYEAYLDYHRSLELPGGNRAEQQRLREMKDRVAEAVGAENGYEEFDLAAYRLSLDTEKPMGRREFKKKVGGALDPDTSWEEFLE